MRLLAFLLLVPSIFGWLPAYSQEPYTIQLTYDWSQTDLDAILANRPPNVRAKIAEVEATLQKKQPALQMIEQKILLAQLLLFEERFRDSLTLLSELIEQHRTWATQNDQALYHHGTLLSMQGMLHLQLQQFDLAAESFQRLLSLRNKNNISSRDFSGQIQLAWANYLLGLTRLPVGDFPSATTHLRTAENHLAQIFRTGGANDSTRSLYSLTRLARGHVELRQGLPDQALIYFQEASQYHLRKATELNAIRAVRIFHGLAECYLLQDENDLALQEIQKAFEELELYQGNTTNQNRMPELAQLYALRARIYRRLGRLNSAIQDAQTALNLLPMHTRSAGTFRIRLLVLLAELQETVGEFDPARDSLNLATLIAGQWYPFDSFPDGHPDLAFVNYAQSQFYFRQQRYEEALNLFERSLSQYQSAFNSLIRYGSDDLAGHYLSRIQTYAENWLHLSTRSTATVAYTLAWEQKSLAFRLVAQRTQLPRAQSRLTEEQFQRWNAKLAETRRWTNLITKTDGPQQQLDQLMKWNQNLRETLLQFDLDTVEESRWSKRYKPADLAERLPEHAAVLDFFRYDVPNQPGESGRYAVFITRPGQKVLRIELQHADEIDRLIQVSRCAAESHDPSSISLRLRELIWDPIQEKIPSETKFIYLSLDGELFDYPLSLLPSQKPNQILLEHYTFSMIPNGNWLTAALKDASPPPERDTRVLLERVRERLEILDGGLEVADLEYSKSIENLRKLSAQSIPIVVDAVVPLSKLLDTIATATHLIWFRGTERSEFRLPRRFGTLGWSFVNGDELYSQPLKDPALMTVFPYVLKSNQEESIRYQSRSFAAYRISAIPLDNLRLAILDADGQGPIGGLDRDCIRGGMHAFHLAGCKNVISSLWACPEEVAQLLMKEFHDRLWNQKMSPVEALRSAQLYVYRNPKLVPYTVGLRGAPDKNQSKKLEGTEESNRRTDPFLWGGFILSGVGK